MMRRYNHLERLGHPEVAGLLDGAVFVFPKLDGSNGSVWVEVMEPGVPILFAASRNRVLTREKDNAGFLDWFLGAPEARDLRDLVRANPHLIFYGEWLVPHSLRTYRPDAWRRFYVFDVYDRRRDRYLSWEEYRPIVREVDHIPPMCEILNPSEEQIRAATEKNTFLIQEGAGLGEGVVAKNYLWTNANGLQPWAKVVRNEFKNAKVFGRAKAKSEKIIEADILAKWASDAWVRKEFAKVVTSTATELREPLDVKDGTYDRFIEAHRRKIIPRTLGTLFHAFVAEHAWEICREFKNPKVDFGRLNSLLTQRIKAVLSEVF